MDLGRRLRLVGAAIVLLVVGAFALVLVATAFAVFLAVGAVLALVIYVRMRLFARRVRKALARAEQVRQAQSGTTRPSGGDVVDAEFKVGP